MASNSYMTETLKGKGCGGLVRVKINNFHFNKRTYQSPSHQRSITVPGTNSGRGACVPGRSRGTARRDLAQTQTSASETWTAAPFPEGLGLTAPGRSPSPPWVPVTLPWLWTPIVKSLSQLRACPLIPRFQPTDILSFP